MALTPEERILHRKESNKKYGSSEKNKQRRHLYYLERKASMTTQQILEKKEKQRIYRNRYLANLPEEERRAYSRNHSRTWNEEHPTYNAERFRKSRAFVNSLKTEPCMDCGGTFPPYVMDFDHRPDTEKVSDLAHMTGRSSKRILEEISKCDLVCANCHRIRTYNRNHN
jgi:N-glycosylase/DNA lyase